MLLDCSKQAEVGQRMLLTWVSFLALPTPLGRRFHWQPLRILKMIASRAARWSTRGLPVLFGGSCSSKIGPIFSHNSSGTRQMVGMGFSWIEFSDIADSYSDGDHQ